MSHDTVSPDTAVALDGWRALIATIPPRSPQLSAGGDLAYIATDDPAVGARVRIVAPTGDVAERIVTEHAEHTPRWSPSGRRLAFVAAGPQGDGIHVVAPDGSTRSTVTVGEGWRVDDLQWIDEGCLALIAAPLITDTAVGRGAQRGSTGAGPLVCTNDRLRRRLVTVDLSTGRPELVDIGPATVWEICPLDRERFVAIVSDDPTESGWYAARLSMLDRVGGEQPLYRPAWQIAAPRVSPDGSRVALGRGVVERSWFRRRRRRRDRSPRAIGDGVVDRRARRDGARVARRPDAPRPRRGAARGRPAAPSAGTAITPRSSSTRMCCARRRSGTRRGAGDHHGGDGARRLLPPASSSGPARAAGGPSARRRPPPPSS